MTTYGVTENGFVLKDYSAIKASLEARIREKLGDDVDLSDYSSLGQIVQSIAYELAEYWQVLESVYYSGYLDTASVANLDAVAAVVGLSRNPATKAIGIVTYSRSSPAPGPISIPIGSRVSTAEGSIVFVTTEAKTLAQGNTEISVAVEAVEPGADGNVAIGAINHIIDPISGLESVTNAAATTLGADAESDPMLRLRTRTYTPDAKATIAALDTVLRAVDGLTDVLITENTTTCAVSVILIGGQDADINSAIASVRPAGILVTWSRATTVSVAVTTTVVKKTGYTGSVVQTNIAAALTEYFASLTIGEDIPYSAIVNAILSADGVGTMTTMSATDGSNTIDAFGETLAIAGDKKATGGTHSITVN